MDGPPRPTANLMVLRSRCRPLSARCMARACAGHGVLVVGEEMKGLGCRRGRRLQLVGPKSLRRSGGGGAAGLARLTAESLAHESKSLTARQVATFTQSRF